jgi:hypothetical protein
MDILDGDWFTTLPGVEDSNEDTYEPAVPLIFLGENLRDMASNQAASLASLHDTSHHVTVEDALDEEPNIVETYPGAGV